MASRTIDLDEQTAAAIQQLAADEKRPASEVVRDALALYAQQAARPLPIGLGKYHSGRSDVSAQARSLIRDAVNEGQWPMSQS